MRVHLARIIHEVVSAFLHSGAGSLWSRLFGLQSVMLFPDCFGLAVPIWCRWL